MAQFMAKASSNEQWCVLLRGEAFAAGAMRGGVWIGDFEATLLQVIAEIQGRAADEQGTLGIDHYPDIGGMNQNVPWRGPFDEVHFVLQTGATAADHCQPQRAFGPALFLEQGTQAACGTLGNANQLFIANLNSGPIRTGGVL